MGGFRDGRRGDRRLDHDLDDDVEDKRVRAEPKLAPGKRTLTQYLKAPASDAEIAEAGTRGAPVAYPHRGAIEAAFGRSIDATAHLDDESAAAANALGTEAFAHGNRVGFREQPSLFVAAHEAAHTLQTAGSVRAFSSDSDAFETHANLAAARVVAGMSAADLFADRGSPASSVVRRLTPPGQGTNAVDFLMRQNYLALLPRIARILGELGKLSDFDADTGVFEGDLSLGVATTIIRLLAPGALVGGFDEADGGAIVHLRLDVYHQAFDLSTKSMHIFPGTIGLVSGDVMLEDVALHGEPLGITITVGEVIALNGTAVRDSDSLQIDSLYLRGLHAHVRGSLRSFGATAIVGEARIHGIRVPNAPIADLDVEQSMVRLDVLWKAVWARAKEQAIGLVTNEALRRSGWAAPRPAPSHTAPTALPAVLPPGARIRVALSGLHARDRETDGYDRDLVASLDGLRITASDRDERELTSVVIQGVKKRDAVPGAKQGIDIARVIVTGSPALVPALLDGDSPLIPHQAKIVLEKLRAHFAYLAKDNHPAMTLTLGPIHLDLIGPIERATPGELAIDNLDLELRDGTTRIALAARDLHAQLGSGDGAIPKLTLRMFDGDREVVAVTVTNFERSHAVDRNKQTHTVDAAELVTITGDASRAPHLLAAIRAQNPALPREVLAALARAAAQIPPVNGTVRAGGKIDRHGGTTDVEPTAPLVAILTIDKVGTLAVEVTGAHATDDDKHTAGGFDRFTATLTAAGGGRVATLHARGGHASSTGKSTSGRIPVITVGGDTGTIAELLDALATHVPQLPDAIGTIAGVVLRHRVSLGAHLDATITGLSARVTGSHVTAKAAASARIELAKGRGVVIVDLIGARHEAGATRFDLLELRFEKQAGAIRVLGGYYAEDAGADKIEATIGSDELLPVLQPAMLELLPAEIVAVLTALRWRITNAVMNHPKLHRPAKGVAEIGADNLELHATLAIDTTDGARYAGRDLAIVVHGPVTTVGSDKRVHADSLAISGAFTITSADGGVTKGNGTITTGTAELVDGARGMHVAVDKITLGLHAETVAPAMKTESDTKIADTDDALAIGREHLGDLTALDLTINLPLRGYPPFVRGGTHLIATIHVRDGAIGYADVTADPAIEFADQGLRSARFTHGVFEVDMSGIAALIVRAAAGIVNAHIDAGDATLASLYERLAALVTKSVRAEIMADQNWHEETGPAPRERDPDDPWAAPTAPAASPDFDIQSLVDLAAATGRLHAAVAVKSPVAITTEIGGAIHGTGITLAIPKTTIAKGRDRAELGATTGDVAVDLNAKTLDVTSFAISSFTWDRAPEPAEKKPQTSR